MDQPFLRTLCESYKNVAAILKLPFMTTVQPAASAAPSFRPAMAEGKFQGLHIW